MRRTRSGLPDGPRHHGQHRHGGLHRPQAALGAQARTGDLRAHPQGAAAQGFRPAEADRRPCIGHVGCFRHLLARCRPSRLVRRLAGRHRARPVAHAPACGRYGADRPVARGALPSAGAWRGVPWWPAGPATTRPRPAASGPSRRAPRSCRSALRACCSSPMPDSRPTRQARCTPSAMPSRTPGTRWA